ncbi:MAG: hypothetical protein WC815_17825 [Vicinamibacterales bacterium]|jgi:hypothetical protein
MIQQFVVAALVSFGTLQATKPPSDFGFQLLSGVCSFEEVDTTQSRYTRVAPDGRKSAKVKLSHSERQTLFDLVMAAKFFDMPVEIRPPVVDGMITVTSPSAEYRLQVRLGGKTHTVSFHHSSPSMTDEGRRFFQLVQDILSVYRQRREVQRLPKTAFEVYCL